MPRECAIGVQRRLSVSWKEERIPVKMFEFTAGVAVASSFMSWAFDSAVICKIDMGAMHGDDGRSGSSLQARIPIQSL